ncbi:MAG TPA: hypothetical protein VFQ55_08575 [Casimicrobiaceae bacterium]|nr:hypothetical protein [Casimicrobiaceae bacterium]
MIARGTTFPFVVGPPGPGKSTLGRAQAAHWIGDDARSCASFSAPVFARQRVDAFRDAAFVGGDSLVAADVAHLAGRDPAWRDLASRSAASLASDAAREAGPQTAANRR